MRKLRRHWLAAVIVVVLSAAPANALAAEEPGAVVPEVSAPEVNPPSTGWVPQGVAAEGADEAPASAQQGSSLGSGESPEQAPSTGSQPPAPEPAPPAAAPTGSYEPEPEPAPPVTEAATSPPEAEPAPVLAPEPVAKPEPETTAPPAVGGADLVTRPTSGVAGEFAESSAAATVANTSAEAAEDSGGLPWLALILCCLILVYAGMRVLLGPVEPDFFRSGRFRFVRRVFPGA